MSKPAWKPWHRVVKLREDLRSGELAMNLFAADLYDVFMGRARPVYGDPREFFALTYPTFNLRQLARDVVIRLAGQSDKAVRQLELSYGGGKTHVLPDKPRDIEDDGDFHFAVLGPKAASSSGSPSAEARWFLDENTGPDRPRVYRNAVVLAAPSREGLDVARTRIRDYLGWEDVQYQLKDQDVDPIRTQTLAANLDGARRKAPESLQLMYGVVVAVSDKNEDQAFKLAVAPGEPLFGQIKADPRSPIQDTAISADALLPEGPYNLWRAGETACRVKDLVGAFAQLLCATVPHAVGQGRPASRPAPRPAPSCPWCAKPCRPINSRTWPKRWANWAGPPWGSASSSC